MTERELHKLSRTDLLELLLAQRKENELLKRQLSEAQAELKDRKIAIDQAGSIAEAALQLNGVFEAAQASCQQYIDNIHQLSRRQEKICKTMEMETKNKCDRMLRDAERRSHMIMESCAEKLKELVDTSTAEFHTADSLEEKGGGKRIVPNIKSL